MSFFSCAIACVVLSGAISVNGKIGFGPGDQDWGHVNVRKGAHMFYWLYYTTAKVSNYTERPLAIWLQGGPGASSTGYGNFEELGPLDLDLNYRNHTWVKDMNVLFIDNPVGTGFSYVDDYQYLTTDNKMIATDLVEFMKAFYNQHPEFIHTPLHIFSESYGGKMAIEFALELYKAVKAGQIKVNLQSVSLGDAWVSPMDSVYSWAPLLLQMGIVDHEGHTKIMNEAHSVEVALNNSKYREATSRWRNTQYVLITESKGVDFYNILKPITRSYEEKLRHLEQDSEISMYDTLVHFDSPLSRRWVLSELMKGPVSKALRIPKNVIWGEQRGQTFTALSEDFMKPVIHIVEEVLTSTDVNVNVFTGQLDLICATPGTVNWINKMDWPNAKKYHAAPRVGVSVGGILEGYAKRTNKFAMFWINRAGHMVPNDNPAGMSYILKETTNYG